MVKGISKQVIVVHSPDPKMFEQAIFILKDGRNEISDEALLKEAMRLLRTPVNLRENYGYTDLRGHVPALV